VTDPHADQPLIHAGLSLEEAGRAVLMIHGRNASPRNILELMPRLDRPAFAYLAPAAASRTWYPFSFLVERHKNEPYLTSAIHRLSLVVNDIVDAGISADRIVFLGFSQGACLAAEFAYRHATRYGGIVLFSGGLIGPPGTTWTVERQLDGTPIFLGCSDVDPHVPQFRVDESADVFTRMGAEVSKRIYPGMGHVVSDDEIAGAQSVLDRVPAGRTI
jgi:phospholipase/carboxylesterase